MTRDTLPVLSKSRFIGGLQCAKQLYLECYSPRLADPIGPDQRALFESGTAVGVLARERFPGGHLISHPYFAHARAISATKEALSDTSVPAIYEGAFFFDDLRIRADILARNSDGTFDLIEVKSSTSVHDEHVADAAIQLYVLEGSGVTIGRARLLHIDNSYTYRGGTYDLDGLFGIADIMREARAFTIASIPGALDNMREALRGDEAPTIEVGPHCKKPHTCRFYGHCHRGVTEHPIGELPSAKVRLLHELKGSGIGDIREIPSGFAGLSPSQRRVRDSVVSGQPIVDAELSIALQQQLKFPLHFLDFETFGPALPAYVGTRPYQAIPFQWSIHVRGEGGDLRHLAFLHDGRADPRDALAISLIEALGRDGSIVAYSPYEQTVISRLASELPAHAGALRSLSDRIVDLHAILRRHYYHPDFHGSYSLKDVLPVLAPDIGYEDLEIQGGMHASDTYGKLIVPGISEDEKRALRKSLIDYCGRDTEAMVRIYDALR